MKVIAYTALHYGKDFLASAIRSVIDTVDEYHVIYSAVGSHGHRSDRPCPESRDELYEIARQAGGSKFHWHQGEFAHEGYQRDAINTYVPDADVILVLDADEVWSDGLAEHAVENCNGIFTPRRFRVPIIHYWRSMYRAVLYDPAFPERVIVPLSISDNVDTLNPVYGVIHHFGYAQRPEIVEYKQHVHGHKGEWRKDVDWYNDRFMANAQHDCHPVGSDYWNPEAVDPFTLGLPEWMRSHPYAQMGVIE